MAATFTKDSLNLRTELASLSGIKTKAKTDLDEAMRNRFIDDAFETKKTATAVDVFIYDTGQDSDGGLWRKRCQHTSWYNEELNTATRGSRREFPAVAVIVAEAAKVTIYDGDDPTLPMWMVFNRGATNLIYFTVATISCVNARNSVLFVGGANDGMIACNFVNEVTRFYREAGSAITAAYSALNIKLRNSHPNTAWIGDYNDFAILDYAVNDVDLTILPDAGTDPATGLQYVTAAVATDGGVSVIRNIGSPDESVVDIINGNASYTYSYNVCINNDGEIFFQQGSGAAGYNGWVYGFKSIPSVDTTITLNTKTSTTGPDPDYYYNGEIGDAIGYLTVGNNYTGFKPTFLIDKHYGDLAGLTRFLPDPSDADKGLKANITSSYNTGMMPGDIKLATLADTDTDSIVGAELMDTVDDGDWTLPTGASVSSNDLTLTDVTTGQDSSYPITCVIGKTYIINFTVSIVSGNQVGWYSLETNILGASPYKSSGDYSITFIANATNVLSRFRTSGTVSANITNISVREAVEDRSVNANGLAVYGTITRTPVNTGNDLVAYSGFSAANYLEQPNNSEISDIGTGDFYVMGWCKWDGTTGVSNYMLSWDDDGLSVDNVIRTVPSTGTAAFFRVGSVSIIPSDAVADVDIWNHYVFARSNGVLYIYKNAIASATSAASTDSVTTTDHNLYVGKSKPGNDNSEFNGSLALIRLGAGALTADEIRAIYEAERPLFQAGAQSTLYGSSDAVTALAHDPVTDLLHVGTSSGRSVFDGLQRVDNTTTAVAAAISANNKFVLES